MAEYSTLKIINGYVCKQNASGAWVTVQHGINPYLVKADTPDVVEPTPTPTPSPSPSGAGQKLLDDWAYWEDKGYTYDQAGVLAYQETKYDLKNRPDQVRWVLEQAGMSPTPGVILPGTPPIGSNCPLENATKTEGGWVYRCKDVGNGILRWGQSYKVTDPPTPTPTPTPIPSGEERYILEFVTSASPELSGQHVSRFNQLVEKTGWSLETIENTGEGYKFHLKKNGSVTIVVIVGLLIAAVAFIIFKIVKEVRLIRVSDNLKIQTEAVGTSVDKALDYCKAAGLTPEECNDIVNAVKTTYIGAVIDPTPTPTPSPFGGLMENLPLLIGGIMVITLVQTLKK